jgi:autotransporter-associated beta strand protein
MTTGASANVIGSKLVISGPVDLGSNVLTLAPALATGGTSASSAVPIEVSGSVSGAGAVVVAADPLSSVLLSGNNSYNGGTTVNAGTLRVGSATAVGTGAVAINAGTLDLNGRALQAGTLSGSSGGVITSSVAGAASLSTNVVGNSTFSGSIVDGAGVVSLAKTGTGGLYLTGSNGYTGGTTVTSGVLQNGLRSSLTDFNSAAFGSGAIVVSGSGTVQIRNNSTITNNFNVSGSGATSGAANLGSIRGSFGTSGQTATVSGSVTLSGDTRMTTGASAGVTGSKMVISGPVDLGSNVLTLAPALAETGTSAVSSAPIEVSGRISGAGSVVIAADPLSSVLLSGSNSYSGGTTVNAGTLRVGSSAAVGTGALTVNTGGILDVNGQSLSVGSLQLNSGGTVQMGISGTAAGLFDQVVSASTVTFGGTLELDFTTNGFGTGDLWQLFSGSSFSGQFSSITTTGSYGSLAFVDVGNGEWKADLGNGQTMSFYANNNQAFNGRFMAGQLVVVPEPSTLVIAGIGVCLAGWQAMKRRRRGDRRL